MYLPLPLLCLLLSTTFATSKRIPSRRFYSTHDYYVLEHDPRSPASVTECALALGAEVVEQAGELRNHWLLRVEKPTLQRRTGDAVLDALEALRKRAAALEGRSLEDHHARRISTSIRSVLPQTPRQRTKRGPLPQQPPDPSQNMTAQAQALRLGIKDPIFPDQWHLVNDEYPQHMLNVTGVWEMGITGKGVISAMVDDGVDMTSDDLAANYDAEGSWDFNDHDPEPKPVLWDDHHGTRCAGEIAAVKNDVCGVGIAYDSKIAGVRILSGPISDVDEAAALNYGFQTTSIYSCSWGPPDDGRSMEGPGLLVQKAVLNGINNGRGGKGSIFVFASGNGAGAGDQCNFDGYTNSIYSVTVSAVDYKGKHPYYSESCAANMIVTYSSGGGKNIHTTDVGKNVCSTSHGGTSAAAPLATGIFALALEIRPDLTWRDIQHLCVNAAVVINGDDPDWERTNVGRPYSYKYGYGKLDAYAFVTAARDWQLVKPQSWIEIDTIELLNANMTEDGEMSGGEPIVPGGVVSKTIITSQMMEANNFEKLEHITVKVWISHSRRGDVEVELVSPRGVKSVLAASRPGDDNKDGFRGWQFMTLKHWDEDADGEWSLRVSDQNAEGKNGSFLGWSMTLWGSSIDPNLAKPYHLPGDEPLPEPPSDSTSAVPSATDKTKTHSKPTAHLPGDHGHAEGEADSPAFASGSTASPTMSITPDEGYFSHMSDLLGSQTWLFGALGAVAFFGISAGIFFWRRRVRQQNRGGLYTTVSTGEDVPMGSMDPGGRSLLRGSDGHRTKELYDAFGELSDDDDDDEEMALQGGPGRSPVGLRYHDGFLDDDGPPTATTTPIALYRDDTDGGHSRGTAEPRTGGSPESGSDSWEHASDALRDRS